MRRRGIAALAIAAAAVFTGVAPAGAATGSTQGADAQAAPLAGDIRVNFTTYRFVSRNGRLAARGRVVATYTSAAGEVTSVAKRTTARVQVTRRVLQGTGRTCTVLRLVLGPVNLNLLGLEVDLRAANGGPIILTITANRRGGILGQLFCSLSRRNILGRNAAATARRLNSAMMGSEGLATGGLGAPLTVATSEIQQVTCPILNLVLGAARPAAPRSPGASEPDPAADHGPPGRRPPGRPALRVVRADAARDTVAAHVKEEGALRSPLFVSPR